MALVGVGEFNINRTQGTYMVQMLYAIYLKNCLTRWGGEVIGTQGTPQVHPWVKEFITNLSSICNICLLIYHCYYKHNSAESTVKDEVICY